MQLMKTSKPKHILTLELTQRELEFLRCVVGSITGSSDGPRGCSDDIYNALSEGSENSGVILFDEVLKAPDSWKDFEQRLREN